MRRTRLVLTSEAALVAAMLGRMGWLDWFPQIHLVLSLLFFGSVALIFLLIGAAVFIGLPVLVLVCIGRGVVWLFRPVVFPDAA